MIIEQPDLPSGRAVIAHVDDLGASHGANQAFIELAARDQITCGSVMVPGPWFQEIARAARADRSLDIGVHLTLTSEWATCRWAPVSTLSKASGLIDDDGYFWRDLEGLRQHLVPEAAEIELRTQIERAIAADIRLTHIDAHMAAAMLPGVLEAHIRLGREYGLVPILPRSIGWAPDPVIYQKAVRELDELGAPVVDHCRGTLAVDPAVLVDGWRSVIEELPPGLTHLALHCTALGDFASMAPDHAGWRSAEYELLSTGLLSRILSAASIETVGTRQLQKLWISAVGNAST